MKPLGSEHATGKIHYDVEADRFTDGGFQVTRYNPIGQGLMIASYQIRASADQVAAFMNQMAEFEARP